MPVVDAALSVIRCHLHTVAAAVTGDPPPLQQSCDGAGKRGHLCQAALNVTFHGVQPVVTGGAHAAGREHQPVGLGINAPVAAVRPDGRRI